MIINDIYKTINAPSVGVYKEKGSKFLAFAYPVTSTDEIKEHLAALKKKYFDARHHCFAYRLGANGATFRANDDGEPSGTAGRPIHGQMLSFNVTNILIVVVRYFGGIKLGTSGLINAYKTSAADALNNADIIEKTEDDIVLISFAYEAMNDVMRIIKDENLKIENQTLEIDCKIKFSAPKSKIDTICKKLSKIKSVNILQ